MRRCPAEIAPRRYMGNAFLAGQSGGVSNSKIKEYLNSTVGTDNEISLDKLIPYYIALQSNDTIKEYEVAGTYLVNVPIWATKVSVTAAAGGGAGGYMSHDRGGGGGGGAAVLNQEYTLPTTINKLTITIGAGGVYSKTTVATNGENTTITEINLTLIGGKGGNGATGGAAGGTGGGAGGNADRNGSAGILGAGGRQTGDDYNTSGGGGGGSIGAGGNGRGGNETGSAGIRGGGGGGCSSSDDGYNGGDGYCKLQFLP